MGPMARLLSWTFCVLIPLVPGGLSSTGQPVSSIGQVEAASTAPTTALPPGTSTDWWSQAQKELACREYHASVAGGRLQAPNRAQNLRTIFEPQGLSIVPRAENSPASAWQFEWRTVGFGREGSLRRVEPAQPIADGARVEYRRDGLVEWYENRVEGIEQGFTLPTRPAGEGKVVVSGRIPDQLEVQLSADCQEIDLLNREGVRVLRYGNLHVYDACQRELPARLAIDDDEIAILIDDRHATYPVTIDPLMTSPAWVAEGNQTSAFFGVVVATAGDVNGDGFSDVIVGAHSYDNGQADEGRAYVYHGTAAGLANSPAWIGECNQEFAYFGESAATAGDVNGDGYSDVIVGARFYSNGQFNEGRTFVYHGSVAGLASTPAWMAESNQAFCWFGISVATAGDVNRDGYSDVIIGAYEYTNGQSDEGRAFVYHGSAGGLLLTSSWTAESNQAGARFGISVATAGDVNGDGYSDVVVGAYQYDNGMVDEGRAFAYHGSVSGLAATPAWTAESDQADAQFGFSVATAGDVNGDGYSDVIVGAHKFDNGQADEGRALVYPGSGLGLRVTPAWSSEDNQANAFFGYSVATAGDVNGDGFSDVIVGVIQADASFPDEGRAFLYQGSAAGLGAAPWIPTGGQAGALYGCSVATAGDVNGDGFSDAIVGAYVYDSGQTDEGRAFSYHGSAAGLNASHGWMAESNQSGAFFGYSVATAGDANGDGYSDVIVGAYLYDNGQSDEGRVFFFPGSAAGPGSSPTWMAEGNQIEDGFGYSLASAGDVNGDGYSDIIIGAWGFSNGEDSEGRAFVYHGSSAGPLLFPAWIAESNQAGGVFGFSVRSAGDVNGDGCADVIVGAPGFDNGQANEGRVFVYHGSPSGLTAAPVWTAESDQLGGPSFGSSVATAGDVNGDRYSDVIIGAYSFENGENQEGRVFVYHGSEEGLATTPAFTYEGNQPMAAFGESVSTAGDINGDGFSDVIIGTSFYDNGEINEGRAFLFQGSPIGLSASPTWIVESNQVSSGFGASVATAGDVNGDGYSDVIVGAPHFDNDQPSQGRAFVYHGSATGLSLLPSWIVDGDQYSAGLGRSVSAGDVNGDGFSDVIVGAYLYSNGSNSEGAAFVYFGNGGDGLDIAPLQMRADNTAPIDLLGRSDSETAFRLKALGRTPAGRGRVRLQLEVKPFDTPFDGTGLVTGSASDTGTPGNSGSAAILSQPAGGLTSESLYHWRLRILTDSPFFPRSRWLWLPGNGVTEADVRTASGPTAVSENLAPSNPLRLGPSSPNPFDTRTEISYTLARDGRLRLTVYDVLGREVAVLADGMRSAGRHRTLWDGRSAAGASLPAGVYFLRLDADGHDLSQKIVIAR